MASPTVSHYFDNNCIISSSALNNDSSDELFDPFHSMALEEQPKSNVIQGVSGLTFDQLTKPVTLYQDISDGCGGKIWDAANVMIDYILWKNSICHGAFLKDKKVVDLGSGTGLVGIATALGCTNLDTMVLTDQSPMMGLLSKNIQLNGLGPMVRAEVVNWGEALPPSINFIPHVILASDCVYHEDAFQPLLDTLLLMSTPDTDIYMTYQKRRKADKRFFQMARKRFVFTEIDEDPRQSNYIKRGLKLYHLKKKNDSGKPVPLTHS